MPCRCMRWDRVDVCPVGIIGGTGCNVRGRREGRMISNGVLSRFSPNQCHPGACFGEMGWGDFQAGVRPDSPLGGDFFLLLPSSTVIRFCCGVN